MPVVTAMTFLILLDLRLKVLTCQLPLFGRHFASSLDHGDGAKVAVGDAHEKGEETRPGGVGQSGGAGGVHAHHEQRDEHHPQAGEKEQAAPGPLIGQSSQDLQGDRAGGSMRLYVKVLIYESLRRTVSQNNTETIIWLHSRTFL